MVLRKYDSQNYDKSLQKISKFEKFDIIENWASFDTLDCKNPVRHTENCSHLGKLVKEIFKKISKFKIFDNFENWTQLDGRSLEPCRNIKILPD